MEEPLISQAEKKSLFFFFFFLDLRRLDLLFGEVRGVVGEVRLVFDLMAPFILGCSPGKSFPPWGHGIFHGRGSVRERALRKILSSPNTRLTF